MYNAIQDIIVIKTTWTSNYIYYIKRYDSQRKKWGVGWGGRGVRENPFDKEDEWNNLFKVCIYLNFLNIETLVMKWCRQTN